MSPPKDHHHHSASLGEALPPLHPVAGSVSQRETEDPLVSGISLLSLRDTAEEEQEPEEAVRGKGRRQETESQDFLQA